MRIRPEHNSTVFEYERKPMPEGRFKALCGFLGVLLVCVVTVLALMVVSA